MIETHPDGHTIVSHRVFQELRGIDQSADIETRDLGYANGPQAIGTVRREPLKAS
jgi:hypothetical protein